MKVGYFMKKLLFLFILPFLFIEGCFFGSQSEVEDHLGERLSSGEYVHSAYGSVYSVYVDIIVKDNLLFSVSVDEKSNNYTKEHPNWDSDLWLDEKDDFIDFLIGKNINEILSMNITIDEFGSPNGGVADLITDATQSSGRLLLAIQNAIENLS